jgi:DNA-binding CsgD family transcriptional regulator
MDGSGHLRCDDGERMLRVIDDAWHDDPGPIVPAALLDGMRTLMGAGADATYQLYDPRAQRHVESQCCDQDGRLEQWRLVDHPHDSQEEDRQFFELWWHDAMCSYPQRTGDLGSVVMTADFYPTAADAANTPMRRDVVTDCFSVMLISLPTQPGLVRRIVMGRAGPPRFSERDREVAALLRPHIQEVVADADRRRNDAPELTPREWEVLGLVAHDLTHAQVARRLRVSVRTVHKHMENIREKLGVHSAAGAVAAATPFSATRPWVRGSRDG